MLYANYFLIFEVAAFVAFALIVGREIYQRNYFRIFEIASCAVFGMILEIGNTNLAHTYSYGQHFFTYLGQVPLAIGLGWAVIIYCVMLLSDQYRIPWTLRPFMDALTAVILDLGMDAVAIRLGFWTWSIPLDKEWYGVPFENLVGWILVVLSFSFVIRFLRTLNYKRLGTKLLMILSPFLSYLGLMVGLVIYSVIAILPDQINNWANLIYQRQIPDINIMFTPHTQLWKLILFAIIIIELIHIVVWSLIKYRRRYSLHFDLLSFSAITALHLFFTIAVFSTGFYRELPILIFLSLGSFACHLLIHFLPYLINRQTVYLFKTITKTATNSEEQLEKIIDANLK